MKKTGFLLGLLLSASGLSAQKGPAMANPYAVTDKQVLLLPDSLTGTTADIAAYIGQHFYTDQEKTRAVFTWLATYISYDVSSMFALNFYEKPEEKISKTLRTRKGICENYAALFTDICRKMGIRTYTIEGYTRQNGFTDFIPHAWCAALLDGSWFLFDPTWGSGYISNKQFVKRINNSYYKAMPAALIKSHMPFDPMWQFLDHIVTSQEFYDEQFRPDASKTYFSYKDSILAYDQMDHITQLRTAATRIEGNGVRNSLVYDRLQHIKMELEQTRQNTVVEQYNTSVAEYNEGVNKLNDFINYRNKQFTPAKADADIQAMTDAASVKLKQALERLAQIKDADAATNTLITQLKRSVEDAAAQVNVQEDWLKQYFPKGKRARKAMFYTTKITWFGIPLN